MTTGFQFAHIDWYSQAGAKKQASFGSSHGVQRGRGWSNADILAEATRKPGNCDHVDNPQPPTICHGSVQQVEDAIEAFVASQTVKVRLKSGEIATRKARADTPSMAAGVISFPRARIDEWPAFRDNAVKELETRHGDRLRCVLEHLDEAHPHLHYYLVPRAGEDFGVVHDGYAASREARKAPENKIRTAFNQAMSKWQDWVQDAMGRPFGLARIGPGRARKSRQDWKADERARLDELEKSVMSKATELDAKGNHLDKLFADLERREGLLERNRLSLDQINIQRTSQLAAEHIKHREQLDRLIKETEKSLRQVNEVYTSMSPAEREVFKHRSPGILDKLRPAVEAVKTAKTSSQQVRRNP